MNDRDISLVHMVPTASKAHEIRICEFYRLEESQRLERELLKLVENYELTGVNCSWVLNSNEYKLLKIDELEVAPEELKFAVRWRIKDLIDFPVDQAAIDIFKIPPHGPGKRVRMLYVVVSRLSNLQEGAKLIKESGLNLTTIDVDVLALRNLSNLYAHHQEGIALLALSPSGSQVLLTRDKNLYLTHKIELPVNDKNISSQNVMEALLLELQRAYDYYVSQLGFEPPEKLLLAPSLTNSEHLLGELRNLFRGEVELLDLNKILITQLDLNFDLQAHCLTAIGGALREEDNTHATAS